MLLLVSDLRYALRLLVRQPGFTGVATATLALGIGANVALFSVVDAVLLRPLPYADPDRLVALWETVPEKFRVAPANYLDWRARAHSFEDMAAFSAASSSLTGDGEAAQVDGAAVTPTYFSTLGRAPLLGRGLDERDVETGAPSVVVLGHELWLRHFAGDPQVLGRPAFLDGQAHVVVGVMPPGPYPTWTTPAGRISFAPDSQDFWVPLRFGPQMAQNRRGHFLGVVARLRPGVSRARAQDEMTALSRDLAREHPEANEGESALVRPLLDEVVGDARGILLLLLAAVGLVVLVACANVAGLLLARGTRRRPEIALRAALGASRARLVRQLLTEGAALGGLGALLGWGLAVVATEGLTALWPGGVPRLDESRFDLRVFGFALAVSLLATLAIGLLPALRAAKGDLLPSLKGGRAVTFGSANTRWRSGLVIGQVATAFVLLAGASLLLRSFSALRAVDPGFEARGVLLADVVFPRERARDAVALGTSYDALLAALGELPGLHSAALAYDHPLESNWIDSFTLEGGEAPREPAAAQLAIVSDGYFRTLGLPLRHGRPFSPDDRAGRPGVAIVNEAFVRRHVAFGDPLGQVLRMATPRAVWGESVPDRFQIVGVAADVRSGGLASPGEPAIYLAAWQFPAREMTLLLRTAGEPWAQLPAVKTALGRFDRNLPLGRTSSLPAVMSAQVSRPRFGSLVFGLFAGLALLLAAVGLYGLLAQTVAARTPELAIRLALGAGAPELRRLVLREGLAPVILGLGLGLLGALALSRFVEHFLFGVRALDPASFIAAGLVLAGAASAALVGPLRRAVRTDPLTLLRAE